MHDLVIRGGTLVDGSGAPARAADVAVEGNTIVAVGAVGAGRREIDARGLLVTPGFVDVHTHYDAQVTWDPYLTPSGWHGCTTVVFGNCGVGFAPAKPDRREWLIGLMEGVEDIPGSALTEGIQWEWETFPEYLDAIERKPRALDVAAQVPHGALRAYVMGERGAANEEATAEDIAEMARLVGEGLRAGALGFTTSRTMLHKSIDGVPVPGTFASRDELFGLGMELKKAGFGVFHVAGEHVRMAEEFPWMRELAQATGRTVSFAISQTDMAPQLWRDLVGMLDEARAAGIPIYGQVAGRSIGILMCWDGTAHPFAGHPTWARLAPLPPAERLARLKDPAVRAQILGETPVDLGPFGNMITRSFNKMYAFGTRIDYEPAREDSIAAVSARTGRAPLEIAYDALMESDGSGMIYFPLFNYADNDLELLNRLHRHPQTRMGLSDGGAHCGAICDGGMPTFMLTHWTRDRTRGEKIPLEHIVRRQTRETAEYYGLLDRGLVAPGYKADLNVIDYANLRFEQPRMAWDLPANARRLVQKASGYVATICSGVVVSENGEFTGALPGKLVRGPRMLHE